eukprot:364956-Chlamydomonas_euryale.AAC.1
MPGRLPGGLLCLPHEHECVVGHRAWSVAWRARTDLVSDRDTFLPSHLLPLMQAGICPATVGSAMRANV